MIFYRRRNGEISEKADFGGYARTRTPHKFNLVRRGREGWRASRLPAPFREDSRVGAPRVSIRNFTCEDGRESELARSLMTAAPADPLFPIIVVE